MSRPIESGWVGSPVNHVMIALVSGILGMNNFPYHASQGSFWVTPPVLLTANCMPPLVEVIDSSPVKNHPSNPSAGPSKVAEQSRWNRKPSALPVMA